MQEEQEKFILHQFVVGLIDEKIPVVGDRRIPLLLKSHKRSEIILRWKKPGGNLQRRLVASPCTKIVLELGKDGAVQVEYLGVVGVLLQCRGEGGEGFLILLVLQGGRR